MTTQYQALQPCQAFSSRPLLIRADHDLVTPQLCLVGHEVRVGNISIMVIVDDHTPLIPLNSLLTSLFDTVVVQTADRPGASEHIGARIDRVMQRPQKHRIGRRQPHHRVYPRKQSTNRVLQTLTTPPLEHLPGTAEFVELLKHRQDRMQDCLVAALHPLSEFVDVVTGGRNGVQLTAGRFVPTRAHHPLDGRVDFQFTHLTPYAEHQAIRGVVGIIDCVLVSNQCAGEAAQVQQMVPVRTVARQSCNL